MGTFQERILKCNQHNIATAAYYSAKEHLYVAFGTGRGSLEAGPSSVVCRFRDIKEQFDDDFKSCYTYLTSSGYTPPRWKNCNNDRKYMCKRNKNFTLDNFCTKDRHLDGIENLEHWNPHKVSLIQTDNSKLFTSVYAQNLTGHSSEILWVGTSDGLLLKADSNSPKVYGRFDLTKNRSIKIEADVETDQSGSYAYFLYGNKVSKFPLYSCQFHTTCGACVKSNDSLVCGWCKDACLQEGECSTTWYNTSCPPFIHKISLESGPVEGGTVLYLTGENFGKPNISSSSVSIGTSKCEEIEWNDTNICCNLTSSENGPFTSQIIVEIHPQKSINGYEIKGKSEVGVFNFSFKVPVVTSMSPSFGPRRGNTIVTITGNNLDIGSNTVLSMCEVIRKSSSNLVCKINECLLVQSGRVGMKYTKQCPYCDDVIMEIDRFKTVINGTFCYKQNPHIERISRTSTTTSGELKFKIKGRQFDSVHNYVFRSVINATHNEDMNCTQTNGTELMCETPDLTNMSIVHSSLQVVVLLENDDFYWKHWTKGQPFYIRVHQDPEIEGLKEILSDTHLLELQGRNLEGLQTEDIRVTLDDIDCPMVDVTPTSLKCDLTIAIDQYQILERGLALRTKISIGNLDISLGYVTIQHQGKGLVYSNGR
ncbi:hepatocyte growth factor receptor-like isoform X2 [Ostrea edulis]|uniref:hepatocyte growth factor receptor-like isoform X2 n=1 Tax=Ostrea edulis TaxID=37623 RepID=UPI0024AEFF04|nr:hepatocyte growth factor receptor-like isoform X2 [Ostrea edulis]